MRKRIIVLLAALCVAVMGGCASLSGPNGSSKRTTVKAVPSRVQKDSRLAILPFTGAQGSDGDAIARFFSYDETLNNNFNLIVRTQSNMAALDAEQKFQASGYTDSDTIAEIGKMLNAQYVISGHFRQLAQKRLVIATIIDVKTLEQLAGDYQEFQVIDEVESLIPGMVNRLIEGLDSDTSGLPKIAVVPFSLETLAANEREAEALAQILAIEIGRTGKYAVLPRTAAAQTALKELDFQGAGKTADEERAETGKGFNAEYVVSGIVSGFGNRKQLEAFITNIKDGSQKAGGRENYKELGDGLKLMNGLAIKLTR